MAEFGGIEFQAPQPIDLDRRDENELTRSALQRASDRLVDETVQTPWQRRREEEQKRAAERNDA